MGQNQLHVSPLQSVVAGAAAGGLESLVTYPTEYVKTRKQLLGSRTQSPFQILVTSLRTAGPGVLYTGASAFCISNASKSGIRFLTFDTVKRTLPRDPHTGKSTTFANMIAGVSAGIAEALTVVTPGENLKTKIVDDRANARQFRSSSHALRAIVTTEGLSGLFRGALPVTMKQGSNAFVRFTSYNAILDTIQPWFDSERRSASASAVAGASAGVVTVYATMPFDNVKTKMQALNGATLYRSTWHCFCSVYRSSGLRAFWEGTTPRLVRLSVSGALSFTIYAQVIEMMQHSSPQIRQETLM